MLDPKRSRRATDHFLLHAEFITKFQAKKNDLVVVSLSLKMARPEGFEPPTTWFVARYSIQLSYGRSLSSR